MPIAPIDHDPIEALGILALQAHDCGAPDVLTPR
jgi:hypothetical protein